MFEATRLLRGLHYGSAARAATEGVSAAWDHVGAACIGSQRREASKQRYVVGRSGERERGFGGEEEERESHVVTSE